MRRQVYYTHQFLWPDWVIVHGVKLDANLWYSSSYLYTGFECNVQLLQFSCNFRLTIDVELYVPDELLDQ